MTKSAMIRARMEPGLKHDGESVLKELGLSTSDFINMTFRQLVMRKGLPFEAKIPNAETIKALKEDISQMKRYSGENAFDEMMKDIMSESD